MENNLDKYDLTLDMKANLFEESRKYEAKILCIIFEIKNMVIRKEQTPEFALKKLRDYEAEVNKYFNDTDLLSKSQFNRLDNEFCHARISCWNRIEAQKILDNGEKANLKKRIANIDDPILINLISNFIEDTVKKGYIE